MAGMTGPADKLDDTEPPSSRVFVFNKANPAKPTQLAPSIDDLRVAAIAAGGSPTDLTDGSYNDYYEKFFGETPQKIPKIYQAASPIFYVKKGLPPVFLYHGKFDWVVDVDQSRRLIDKLRKEGVTAEYLEVTLGHVATFLFDSNEIEVSLKFIKKHLAKKY
jgi:dipeptidyl aminopeptidase/acylaminoacyl peptidase